jgi:hypothetical protein
MPRVSFTPEHADEGLMFLVSRGQVGCLPGDVFVVSDHLLELLQHSSIPFHRLDGGSRIEPSEGRLRSRHATRAKVPV